MVDSCLKQVILDLLEAVLDFLEVVPDLLEVVQDSLGAVEDAFHLNRFPAVSVYILYGAPVSYPVHRSDVG